MTTKDITGQASYEKKSDILIHVDTNNLTSDVNMMKCTKRITKIVEEMNDGDDTQVIISGISERRDHNPSEKIESVKKRLKLYILVTVFSL